MGIRPRQPRRSTGSTSLALLLSLLLHVPLLAVLSLLPPDDAPLAPTSFDARSELEVNLLTEEPSEEEEKEEREELEELQIVSLEAPEQEQTPDEARFADQYESRADREQVRKALPGAPATPTPPRPPRPPQPDRVPQPESPRPAEEPAEEEPRDQQMPEPSPAEEAELAEADEATRAPKLVRERPEAAEPPREPTQPRPQELFPTVAQPRTQQTIGEGGSIDYLRDVDEGDKTLLNRKKTRYWAFFDRVKVQISRQWSPVEEYRRRDPYGNVYGVKDRYSTVNVTLNGDGTVRQLYVSRGSGLDFFDEEAIRSIRAAAPFHNPPEGLKDQDGLIHFRFGFFFEINSGSGIRIFN